MKSGANSYKYNSKWRTPDEGGDAPSTAPRATASPSLKGRALRLLAAREHSRAELEARLLTHEQVPGQLAQVLDELQAKDFINEARVVESVINRRAGRFGAARIRHELLHKGLDVQCVAEAVQRLKGSEFERAREVWRKKFDARGEGAGVDPASQARQMRFLAARGFAGDVVGRVVRRPDAD